MVVLILVIGTRTSRSAIVIHENRIAIREKQLIFWELPKKSQMSFHAVACGLVIKERGRELDLLRFTCRNFEEVYGNFQYDGKEIFYIPENASEEERDAFLKEVCFTRGLRYTSYEKFMREMGLECYHDIVVKNEEFYHASDIGIRIGNPHGRAIMIYLACVGDDCGGGDDTSVSDSTLLTLLTWKNNLIEQGRLHPDSNLSFIKNCCS